MISIADQTTVMKYVRQQSAHKHKTRTKTIHDVTCPCDPSQSQTSHSTVEKEQAEDFLGLTTLDKWEKPCGEKPRQTEIQKQVSLKHQNQNQIRNQSNEVGQECQRKALLWTDRDIKHIVVLSREHQLLSSSRCINRKLHKQRAKSESTYFNITEHQETNIQDYKSSERHYTKHFNRESL